jgi:hypothetical protein
MKETIISQIQNPTIIRLDDTHESDFIVSFPVHLEYIEIANSFGREISHLDIPSCEACRSSPRGTEFFTRCA